MAVSTIDTLVEARFIDFVTYRRDGTAVATPVIFVEGHDGLLVRVAHDSGKLKRLRHSNRVNIAACDQRGHRLGPPLSGQARILGPDAIKPALSALHSKYPIAGPLFTMLRRIQGSRNVIIEVVLDA